MTRILLSLFLIVTICSCAPKKKLVYFQGIESSQSNSKADYQPKLQPDDALLIIVSAPDPEAAVPYNLASYTAMDGSTDRTGSGVRYQTYLIDNAGNIEFPVIGTIKLGGLTRIEAVEKLKSELKKFIKSPIVNLRIMNYKVSVMGEVARPGSYPIQTERLTLPEALSMAGDLTIYGDRKNIILIREMDGVRTHTFIDITSSDFMSSPYYYLDQNDQIYVQPNKTRVNSSAVGPNITVGISALSLIITVIALVTR